MRRVHDLVSALRPLDNLEGEHRADTQSWIANTDDIFRRAKPATPPRHLVSYTVVVDPTDLSVFLVDHINAGLWLPTGGHVEPGEHPTETARRETREELGIDADFDIAGSEPLFLTVTTTVGVDNGHVDVSLWYVVAAHRDTEFTLDPDEFRDGRWWTVDEILDTDPRRFDPHFPRFIHKLRSLVSAESA
ncbi:NTP pyrophosphohydrolases including oxidative damage repair enzymes [Rhodococcus wratislaviensis]|uniref:NTP pyrophosphohydrolases including oxidative damage repair enzymes n=1 Tax=Rhodococcus wratislaviensis TaxID=44752 RepID=A0A402C2R5_RHOWR|nr:NTP pyrophosphohydrolases including oxidative damage repair enzymes [Rhodococcus wratislaviensis]